jgi:hypothetical protein
MKDVGKMAEDKNVAEMKSESDFEIELEYNCESLTLDQSIKQVFSIINSVKVPSIERQ